MTGASPFHLAAIAIDSDAVPKALADLVADAMAGAGLTRTSLARQAKMTPKTLRDILEGARRRYGEATLRGLDDALGWVPGTAWRAHRHDTEGDAVALVVDQLDRVDQQYGALLERLARIEEQPTWVDEIVAIGRQLSPGDRRVWIDLGHRLTR
jgi:hypothetical protein